MIWSLYDCKNYCSINFAVSIKLCDWSGRDILINERKYLSQDSRVDYFTRLSYYMVKKASQIVNEFWIISYFNWKVDISIRVKNTWVGRKTPYKQKLKSWVEDEFNLIPILYIFLVILMNRKKLLNIIISSMFG